MSKMEELKARRAQEDAIAILEDGIITMLPDDLENSPTISNVRAAPKDLDPSAWLSFSAPSYDPGKTWNPLAILQALESAGWKQAPASLCKWGDYRRSAYPGLTDAIPDTKGGSWMGSTDKLTDVSPIAPMWIVPCQHTNADAQLFMTAPDGRLFKVSVDVPHLVSIHARRREFRGGWSYERGTAKLQFPEAWHGHEHCRINENSRAQVDTDQGISGAVYFSPHDEQSAWPMSASEFLASLIQEASK